MRTVATPHPFVHRQLLPKFVVHTDSLYRPIPSPRWILTFDPPITSAVPPPTPTGWSVDGIGGPKPIDSVAVAGGKILLLGGTFTTSDVLATWAGGPTVYTADNGRTLKPRDYILFAF